METRANYVLIGAFTIVASIALLGFALWAAKYSSDRSWNEYDVVFREPVTGLTEGSSVQYNGIAVGTVDKLSLDRDDARRVIALLKLNADAPVKVDTKGGKISKIKLPVTGKAMDVCVPVPAPGRYAVAIHHDLNANGSRDINDGAGYSNNPKLSLANLKPAFSRTSVQVGAEPRRVGVVMQYRKGLSVGPVGG